MPVSAWFWQVLCKQYLRGSSRGGGRLFLSSPPPQEFQAEAELYFGCFWIKHCRCCGHTIDHNICTYVTCSHITARGADRARFVSSASWQFLQLSLLSSPGGYCTFSDLLVWGGFLLFGSAMVFHQRSTDTAWALPGWRLAACLLSGHLLVLEMISSSLG